MLKKIFTVLVPLTTVMASAQMSEEIYGINLGGTLSNLKTDVPGYATKSGTGFSIGVSAEKPMESNLSGFIQFNYEQRSYNADYTYSYDNGGSTITNTTSVKSTINVINIPLGLRFYFPDHDFFINAGGFVETY